MTITTSTTADAAPAVRYVQRCTTSPRIANKLRRDLLRVQAALEVAERKAKQLREVRDSMVAELVSLDD